MISQIRWQITLYKFKLDKEGIGEAIYKIQTNSTEYYRSIFIVTS